MFRTMLAIGAVTLGLPLSAPTNATILVYELKQDNTGTAWTWTIDSASVPDIHVPPFVTYFDLTGSFPVYDANPPRIFSIAEICFYTDSFVDDDGNVIPVGGGFEIDENGNNQTHYVGTSGPKLYDEVDGLVTLKTGTFSLIRYDFDTESDDPTITFTLNVGPVPVPEPATWAMMIMGFGGVGASLRKRRVQHVRVAYGMA